MQEVRNMSKGGKGRNDMNSSRLDSIRVFLIYVSRTDRDMNPYLKGLHMILYNRRPHRYG